MLFRLLKGLLFIPLGVFWLFYLVIGVLVIGISNSSIWILKGESAEFYDVNDEIDKFHFKSLMLTLYPFLEE